MKQLIIIFISLLFFIVPVTRVSAHLAGQPPFFKINGSYSNLYPVPTTSLDDFQLPQDLAPENYLVNQPLNFEFDTTQLPVTQQALADTKFYWDFGDGSKGTGLKNTHTYTKMGSYFIVINAQYLNEQPQIIQSVVLNVLPNKDYQLPQAVIKVNGVQSKDPLTDILKMDFSKDLNFDASASKSSGQITSYIWDFGDRQSSNQAKVNHRYDIQQIQVFPVLRVTDSNGFIGDSFLEIENQKVTDQQTAGQGAAAANTTQVKSNNFEQYKIPGAIVLGLILIGVIFWIRNRSRK